MPYDIKKRGSKWVVVSRDSDRVLGTHDSWKKARAQQKAVYASTDEDTMNDVLDKPVPRELMDRLYPEEEVNELDVRELHEDQVVGSLRQVFAPDVNRAILNVTEAGYRYQVVDQAEGPISVLYFKDLNEDAVDAITLHLRDVGVAEPPLSVNEHLKLGGLFGVDEETLRIFKEAVLLEMKHEGLIPSFGPTVVSIPALCCIRPTDFDESALDWARRNAKRYDFVINEVQHTGGEIEVSPVDPDGLKMLKRRLEDDNIIVEDVVQEEEEETVTYECEFCEGTGTVWLEYLKKWAKCLACGGRGTVTYELPADQDESVDDVKVEDVVQDGTADERFDFDEDEEGLDDMPDDEEVEQEWFEGDEILPEEINRGDLIISQTYGPLWITGTGVVGDLWTDSDRDEVKGGRGRGLRFAYVDALQREGRGPWYRLEWNREDHGYTVTAITEEPPEDLGWSEFEYIYDYTEEDEDEQSDDKEFESIEDEADSQVDKVLEAEYYPFGLRGYGRGVGGPRQRDGGVSTCICPKCGHEMPHLRGRACQTVSCPECGAPMIGESLHERVVGKFTHVDDRHHGRGYSEELFQRLLAAPVTEQHIPGDAPTPGQARIAILKSLRHQDVTVIIDQMEGIRDEESHKDGLKVAYFIRRVMDGARIKGPYVAEFWKIGRKWELRTTPPEVEWTDYDVERKESIEEKSNRFMIKRVPKGYQAFGLWTSKPFPYGAVHPTRQAAQAAVVGYDDNLDQLIAANQGEGNWVIIDPETDEPVWGPFSTKQAARDWQEEDPELDIANNNAQDWPIGQMESVEAEPDEDEADDAIAQQIDQLFGTEEVTEEVKYYIVRKEDEGVEEGPFDGPQQAHQRLGGRTDAEDLKVMPMGTDAPEEE